MVVGSHLLRLCGLGRNVGQAGFASYMLVDNGEPKPIVKTCQDFKSEGS